MVALEMPLDVEDYISNPNNVQFIQDALTKKVKAKASLKKPAGANAMTKKMTGKPSKADLIAQQQKGNNTVQASRLSRDNRMVKSLWKKKPRFNGFVFAVNMTGIRAAAHNHPLTLFDPSGLIIGQEDKLIADMEKLHFMPMISLGAFVYHFKSVTVKMTRNKKKEDTREDLSKYHTVLVNSGNSTNVVNGPSSLAYPQLYSTYDKFFFDKPFQRLSAYPPVGAYGQTQRKYNGDADSTTKKKEIVIAFATSGT